VADYEQSDLLTGVKDVANGYYEQIFIQRLIAQNANQLNLPKFK